MILSAIIRLPFCIYKIPYDLCEMRQMLFQLFL